MLFLFLRDRDAQFTVTEERNQKILTFKKLESENYDIFSSKMTQNSWKINKIVPDSFLID